MAAFERAPRLAAGETLSLEIDWVAFRVLWFQDSGELRLPGSDVRSQNRADYAPRRGRVFRVESQNSVADRPLERNREDESRKAGKTKKSVRLQLPDARIRTRDS